MHTTRHHVEQRVFCHNNKIVKTRTYQIKMHKESKAHNMGKGICKDRFLFGYPDIMKKYVLTDNNIELSDKEKRNRKTEKR